VASTVVIHLLSTADNQTSLDGVEQL